MQKAVVGISNTHGSVVVVSVAVVVVVAAAVVVAVIAHILRHKTRGAIIKTGGVYLSTVSHA